MGSAMYKVLCKDAFDEKSASYALFFFLFKLFMKGDGTELENQAATLVLPIVVSLLNLLTPFVFSLLELLEKFQYPRNQIYVTITRYSVLLTPS